jgi:putative ABC transport system ATP-binding protein
MLIVEGLEAGYGTTRVARLSGISLNAGEAGLILGLSGSGKTTLLLAIAGLVRTFAGRVEVAGVNVASLSISARDHWRGRSVGLVFQEIHLIAGLSTLDSVLLAPYAAGLPQDRARALALLDTLGLAGKAHQPAQTLSRGQAQRTAIARAMLLKPSLILADEPTASLDDQACETVCDLLLSAATETGAALLISTHDHRLKARIPRSVAAEPLSPRLEPRSPKLAKVRP